ncbi:MAG: LamG domain-containing protein [Candidatus Diapherotrites archaeon]|nr:LamG domain-containing protein [Candidatus Diapherotrites archaeon]
MFGLFLVASFAGATVVTDTSYADFTNAGVTLNNVTVNAGGDVVLSSSGGVYNSSGTFTSKIFDGGNAATSWSNFNWTPDGNYRQPLPDDGCNGNITDYNMCGNVFLMHFDNGSGESSTLVKDWSGYGNNGSCSGSTCGTISSTSSFLRSSPTFVGSTNVSLMDWYSVPSSSSLNITTDITISFWIKFTSTPYYSEPIDKGDFGSAENYCIRFDSASGIEFLWANGGWQQYTTSAANVTPGTWEHYTLIYHAGSLPTWYKNGAAISASCASGSCTAALVTNSAALAIGSGRDYSWASSFSGALDEVAIWNKTLSVGDVLKMYRRGVVDLNFQVRSCASSDCAGVSFVGPGGSVSSYFTSASRPVVLSVSNNRYFQYKAFFYTSDTSVAKLMTPDLNDVSITYVVLNSAADVNVVKLDGNLLANNISKRSYVRDGNVTVDFNVFDAENDGLTFDLNFSSSASQGSGSSIVSGMVLDAGLCGGSTTWNVVPRTCSYDWNVFGVGDGNYYVLVKVNDGSSSTFKASSYYSLVDNTVPTILSDVNNSVFQKSDANVRLSCSDGLGSGCGSVFYCLDSNASNDFNVGVCSWQTYSNGISISSDGNWGVSFFGFDDVNNRSVTSTSFVLVGSHAWVRALDLSDRPRGFFGVNGVVRVAVDVNGGFVPDFNVIAPSGVVKASGLSFVLQSVNNGVSTFVYDFNLDSNVGWFDVRCTVAGLLSAFVCHTFVRFSNIIFASCYNTFC